MLIRNLSGIFTGGGFVTRDGRRPTAADCGFIRGPVDLLIESGRIVEVGRDLTIATEVLDAAGQIALPGFIDPHTHTIFAGERSNEYFMRWAGKTYLEITEAGGGIHSTVRATAAASDDELRSTLIARLKQMRAGGATVDEVKSGYGKSADEELRLLRIVRSVRDKDWPQTRISFLGLHALPKDRVEDEYVDEMIAALSVVAREKLADQVDTFPEKGFFTLDSALRFSAAAKELGLPCKVHADELYDLGSSAAFIREGALSIDHLQHVNDEAVSLLAESPTVATMLPATSFFVGIPYANARRLIDAGARVALATDFNPGTAPALDLQLTHMLAASQMKMSAAEILCASTYNAAAALGLEKSYGALSPGRAANVLLYDRWRESSDDGMAELQQIILGRTLPKQLVTGSLSGYSGRGLG
jgi:imidazolonepropionase